MSKSIRPVKNETIYSRIWSKSKQFPQSLYQGSQAPPIGSGSAVAALASGGIGSVAMMVAHHLAEVSEEKRQVVVAIGSWMPGALNSDPAWGNLGSYAGEQTIFLVVWLISWGILHVGLNRRHVQARTIFFSMFGLFTLATALAWHPLFPYLRLR